MIVQTDAVVLRSIDYGETSRIVTLYTRHRGKVSVMARGARAAKSRFGSALQPMSYIQAVYYHKPTRELQTLSQASHVQPFNDIGRSLEKMAVGLRIVEIANGLLEEEQNDEIFLLLVRSLATLNEVHERVHNVLPYFQLRLAIALGFEPGFARDSVARLTDEGGVLSLETGDVYPASAMVPSGKPASREAIRAFAISARAELAHVLALDLTTGTVRELDTLIEAYYRHHVGSSYPSRGNRVLNQLLPGG
ncbi:MAG TPA: DNA repair protein RecO [Rhodothermales bacterium]